MTTESRDDLMSDLAVPPGALLAEELVGLSMNADELAIQLGQPSAFVHRLLAGAAPLGPDVARRLERVTGVPAYLWLKAEARYRLVSAKQPQPVG